MSSNVIKGYKQNYDAAAFKKLDMTVREEKLAEKIEDLRSGGSGFVSGLIPAEVMSEENFENQNPEDSFSEEAQGYTGDSGMVQPMGPDEIEAIKAELREEMYAEIRLQAESDFRENLQAEADEIINNANTVASQIISEAESKSRTEAEAIKAGIVSVASAEGYESGLKKAKEEQADALRALEEEKQRVALEYERQVKELEPAFVEILKEYIKKITGIAYDHHTEVLTYLLDQAIKQAPGQTEFVVKLSPKDSEKYEEQIPGIVEKYSDKLSLTFAISADVNDSEVRLENEGRIITTSLELNMTGLLESLDMLSSQD